MPIRIPEALPAHDILRDEGVMVMGEDTATRQDIRPLRIALLNLMPMKIATETQFARLIGAGPIQIELTLVRMSDHESRHTSREHMEAFYRPTSDVMSERFDGLVITGAPIEHLPFEAVTYWDELRRVMDWTRTHVHSTFGVCWGGMALLKHFHGIEKHVLPRKHFGIFRHRNLDPASPYLRGFSDEVPVPVSRWTEVRREDLGQRSGLSVLLDSAEVGPCLIEDHAERALYVFNHFEYDSGTLAGEYRRDLANGGQTGDGIALPRDYFPGDDPDAVPLNRWRSHAHLLYGNWINQIYQTTPYDVSQIGS
ncbi:homoserine O-succinyltransferase [Hasllibacter halocynthiae]|uniref:Homoserine O-acetyltransferase n=1 Tax=Hasllibacter halocynthiae TaxID=595589 RepID=A0A2T0X8D9_9RHOB|nr:homoserine O-succinyltransferase [Hasllibacter halocynthiae]PRY95187.1 homoserine O-succinyltransferase [Hasllibacter halocynthiae]